MRGTSPLTLLASPFGAAYGAVVNVRNKLYDRGYFAAHRLQGPVVSVGNLSVGGSGKTPFVLLLGELLQQRGIKFDVLSRGYGRRTRDVRLVDRNGAAAEFGDEPLLLARRLKAPIIVGAGRYQAGRFAEKNFGPQLHILDDGFQHRSLARECDIALASAEDFADRLLPIGRLREPLSSLRRADVLVLPSGDSLPSFSLGDKLVWRVTRGIALETPPPRPVIFCGIARPANFISQLKLCGVHPVAVESYRDHHAYSRNDIDDLLRTAARHRAGGFITTEKDLINMGGFSAALQPLAVARVTMALADSANVVDTILSILTEAGHPA